MSRKAKITRKTKETSISVTKIICGSARSMGIEVKD